LFHLSISIHDSTHMVMMWASLCSLNLNFPAPRVFISAPLTLRYSLEFIKLAKLDSSDYAIVNVDQMYKI